jgi:hypothetical protein
VTFEGLQALLLKLTGQLRTVGPPPHIVSTLDRIEANVAQMVARGKTKLILAWRQPG